MEITCANNIQARGMISKDQPGISPNEELPVMATSNPGTSFFNLAFKSNDETTPVNVRILDVNGKLILIHQKLAASSMIRIAADNWAGGIYFLRKLSRAASVKW